MNRLLLQQSESFFKINSTLYCTVLFFTLALHHHQSKSIIKMKLKAILICLLVWYTGTQAQTSVTPSNPLVLGTINGKVIDKKNNEPLPYASVTIKEDGKVITGAMTKDNGSFSVSNLPIKTLHVEVVFMGYQKYETDVTLTNDDNSINLKNIALEDEAKQLNEVNVVREKSSVEQKIDRKVITVGKDLLSAGSTAAELINNIPSVSVDQQNNTVSLRGNENVRIFIDGKPSNLSAAQALQQIPSTSIKQIELITNPSAKYNPEGMSGIINIVLHKNSNLGFNGNINTGVVFGKTPKFNGSIDMNYRVNKFNFYTTYSMNHGKNANKGLIHWNEYDDSINDYDMTFDIKNFNKNHFTKLGSDFYINDKNTLSFYTIQSFGNPTAEFRNGVNYFDSGVYELQIQKTKGSEKNQTYNLAYKHLFEKPERTLDIELNYNLTKEPENSLFFDENYSLTKTNNIKKDGNNFIANIDFVNPMSETAKMELGLESRFDGTNNKFNLDGNYDSDFDFNRSIQSAYGNYSKQLGKWSYQLGLRFESYDVNGTFKKVGQEDKSFKDYIFTAYPSAFFTYTPSEKNSFNFNYSRRVDRPNMEQVNEIRQWTGLTVEQIGNSNLKPQFTNSVEANYTRKVKIGSITSGAFFRYIKDDISQVLTSNPYDANKQLLTFTNFDHNSEYGVEISGNLDFNKWWNLNFGVDSYFKNNKGIIENRFGDLVEKEINATLFNSRMNHTFKLTKDIRLIWFTMYRAGERSLQFSNKEMWKMDLGARLNVLKGKGTLSVRYNDLFDTMRSRFNSDEPAAISGEFRWENQTLNINFNYRFGSGKNKALERKQRDNGDAQGGGMF
ncbi:Outer membrane receptor proteins, mostly Fe transport [Flavobacterium terrae]|uniref:Outer membrane receptor proteins, mostly Fe transport n=2 Tax=Flavobacterium terrae TaxID=415425 RepID=A0A1M6D979_9FLAO|nr:Outer membrane receptor proteins, mostly Fe transport [Flavobacterium terrae]